MDAKFLTQLRNDTQNKGQEDTKTSLDGCLSSISDLLGQDIHRDRLLEISSMLSALPEKIDACFQKLKFDLCKTFNQEMQACALTTLCWNMQEVDS